MWPNCVGEVWPTGIHVPLPRLWHLREPPFGRLRAQRRWRQHGLLWAHRRLPRAALPGLGGPGRPAAVAREGHSAGQRPVPGALGGPAVGHLGPLRPPRGLPLRRGSGLPPGGRRPGAQQGALRRRPRALGGALRRQGLPPRPAGGGPALLRGSMAALQQLSPLHASMSVQARGCGPTGASACRVYSSLFLSSCANKCTA
mmetsp:Transcript_88412/g.286282  ORF Transcript_88412/g.286282 Transcript_88412/m.286282 type:complete len:200 (-) Transcript_88412:67-666(-)